jgi:hypothetical protein
VSRGKAFSGGLGFVSSNQASEVITEGAVRAEGGDIEEAFDAAAEADLIGAILIADRPAHLAVPATAKEKYSSSSDTGSDYA